MPFLQAGACCRHCPGTLLFRPIAGQHRLPSTLRTVLVDPQPLTPWQPRRSPADPGSRHTPLLYTIRPAREAALQAHRPPSSKRGLTRAVPHTALFVRVILGMGACQEAFVL